jgi:hypothetical protein
VVRNAEEVEEEALLDDMDTQELRDLVRICPPRYALSATV